MPKLRELKEPVFTVVRQGRRIEPSNYNNYKQAQQRRNNLQDVLSLHDDPFVHKVWIKKTTTPWRIR